MGSQLVVHTVVSKMFGQNAFLVSLEQRNDCVVVDPGFDTKAIQTCLSDHQLTPKAILNTHGHADHIAGNSALKQAWPDCPLVIGIHDADKLTDPEANLSSQFGANLYSPKADHCVHEGEVYERAGVSLEVLELPGHSKGHVVYVWKGGDPWVVFGGDVLFQGSIGRTDFPDGNAQQLLASIRNKLFRMPAATKILPGHGPATTVAEEKEINPFVGDRALGI
ncbi:MAG: MBL fold metallo-hydrolase [Planctomycetota bacterium]